MTQMRKKLTVVVAGLALLLTAAPLIAHHAFSAEFDANEPITLKGTVTRVEWINPHTWIHLNVKATDGTVTEWMVEGGPPIALLRRGLNKYALPAGSEIVVVGYRSKDGLPRANGRDLTFTDGKKLFMGSTGTGAPGDPGPDADKK
jgi:uncharacterized protein DUF6152